jgi:hypothetical protein
VSSAELSREISGLVARVVGGETIDVPAQGAALAARFPELGMSAELIGKAISRAAGMVGHPLDGADQVAAAPGAPPEEQTALP